MTIFVGQLKSEAIYNLAFVRPGEGNLVQACTATVSSFGNHIPSKASVDAGGQTAPYFVNNLTVTGITGNVLDCCHLSQQGTRPAEFYLNSTVTVMRSVDEKLCEVATTTVTGAIVEDYNIPLPSGHALSLGQTEFTYSPDTHNRPGAVIYFSVATVDETGGRSPWSVPVSYKLSAKPIYSGVTAVTSPISGPGHDSLVETPSLPVPTGVVATPVNGGEAVKITWTAPAHHRVIVACSFSSPTMRRKNELIIADASGFEANDLFILRKRFDHTIPKSHCLSSRVWGAVEKTKFGMGGIGFFNEDMPDGCTFAFMSEGLHDFTRLTVPAGKTFNLSMAIHGGLQQSCYKVLQPDETYRMQITGRLQAAAVVGISVAGTQVPQQSVNIGTNWTTKDALFTVDSQLNDALIRFSNITLTGPAVFDLKYLSFSYADAKVRGATPDLKQILCDSGVSHIRMHATIKTRPFSYSMRELLSPVGPVATRGHSVPQSLNILKTVRDTCQIPADRLNPWLQIEPYMTDAELAGFGEYMCTPYNPHVDTPQSKPWAYMRFTQGQTEPWQNVFGNVRLECGNENWNDLSKFYQLPSVSGKSAGWVNGKMLDRMAEAVMAAPGYDALKWSFYLGLWAANETWNSDSIASSQHADFGGFANYNGGWDNGLRTSSTGDDPNTMFRTVANSNLKRFYNRTRQEECLDLVAKLAAASVGRAKPIRAMHYESGPGYVMSGLDGSRMTPADVISQERLFKSVGSGTATLDAFMTNAAHGMVSNNYLTIAEGEYWTSHGTTAQGGAYSPAFQWFCFINKELVGEVRQIDLDLKSQLFSPSGEKSGHAVKLYVVKREDGSEAYVLCNVDPVNPNQVKIRKSTESATWTRHWMTGEVATYNNTPQTQDAVQIQSQEMPAGFGSQGFTVTIPPGKAEVYIARPA